MNRSNRRAIQALLLFAAALGLLAGLWAGSATAAGARTLRFEGREVRVPAGWPVYRLAQHPGMCVRLDRRAVYLGAPSSDQSCPADAIGRRRAILVDPGARARQATSSSAQIAPASPRAAATASSTVFTGLGFDACSAPSTKAMSAWAASPYRGIGVYIGGANRACSQPNLTSSWVAAETAGGWHLIPTYVGLQAPTSACSSCAKLSANQATAQGSAAAVDAVADADAVAMGPGSPIYFDMEAYNPTAAATAATLAFLEAWTKKLHSLGYLSGVYSSTGSGISDLAGKVGSGYVLPDDIWFANWNGSRSTADAVLPTTAWTPHRRIHQYQGGHDERYGGVTINIDGDYLDGGTVGSATAASPDDPVGSLELTGGSHPGEVRVRGWAFDPDLPAEALALRATVGGRAGSAGALEYELGPIAGLPRPAVPAQYTTAGRNHGFDSTFPTVKSGPQPVCVYAVNTGLGADRLLGCRSTPIQVAVTLSGLRATRTGVQVRIACAWPAGSACPGQLMLRAQVKVAQPRRGGTARPRTSTRTLGRRGFSLSGAHSHTYVIPLSASGRQLLREHGQLKTQVIAAISGGRRMATLGLRRLGG